MIQNSVLFQKWNVPFSETEYVGSYKMTQICVVSGMKLTSLKRLYLFFLEGEKSNVEAKRMISPFFTPMGKNEKCTQRGAG